MFDVRLHLGHGLDGGCAGADDGDAVGFPLLGLVVGGPGGGVHDAAFEAVDTFDGGPFVVVEDARGVEEEVAFIGELFLFA